MKRPISSQSPTTPRTPKRIKLSHPQDSPSNPFSPPKPSICKLPPVTSFSKHLPLRFQFKGTRTLRVAQVPCNYTFVHLRALITWLFRDTLNDGSNQATRSAGKTAKEVKSALSASKARRRKSTRQPLPYHILLAAREGDNGPTFKVLKDIEIYEPLPGSHFNEGVISNGKLIAKLSPVHDPFSALFTGSKTNGTLRKNPQTQSNSSQSSYDHASTSSQPSDDYDKEAYVEAGSWLWEPCQEFTLANAWPEGGDIKRGIVYHHNRRQQIHITINTLPLKSKRKGKGNEPYVFIAKGTRNIAPTSTEDWEEDEEDEELRLGWGYGGTLDADPKDIDLRHWNPPEKGQRSFRKWVPFPECFRTYERDPANPNDESDEEELDELDEDADEATIKLQAVKPLVLPSPLPAKEKKKLVFPNLRRTKIDATSLRVVEVEAATVNVPPTPELSPLIFSVTSHAEVPPLTSSPRSEHNPGLSSSFGSSSPVRAHAQTAPVTPFDDDENWLAPVASGVADDGPPPLLALIQNQLQPSYLHKGKKQTNSDPQPKEEDEEVDLLHYSSLTSSPYPSSRHSYSTPTSPSSTIPPECYRRDPLPFYPSMDPTPHPSSKLLSSRIDHWATRRLKRLSRRGIKNGVFDVLDSEKGGSLFGDSDNEDDEEDELAEDNPAPNDSDTVKGLPKPTKSISKAKASRVIDWEKTEQDEIDEVNSDSEENQYYCVGRERMRAESVEV